jgi:hypothetical protein
MSFKEFQNKISKEEAEKNVFEIIDLVKEKGLKKEEMRRGIKKISERKNNKYNSIYFSEKLIDCFLCKSIPIYYGCNNIKNYFNTDGMILINDFDDFLLKVNKLDESFYNSKKEVIDENYFKALKWVDYGKRIISKINEVL